MKQTEYLASVDQHTLQFKDARAQVKGIWTNDPFRRDAGLGYADHSLWMVSFSRAAGNVPVIIEDWGDVPPTSDVADYNGVIEATLDVSSGAISIENESGTVAMHAMTPGSYRVRAHFANKDVGRYDDVDGAEHARLSFYRVDPRPLEILKEDDRTDDCVRVYRGPRTETELFSMLGGESISHRCLAVVGLLRLGGGFDRLAAAVGSSSVSVRRVFASACWMAGSHAEPFLVALAADRDPDLRIRAAQSFAVLDCPLGKQTLAKLASDPDKQVLEALRQLS